MTEEDLLTQFIRRTDGATAFLNMANFNCPTFLTYPTSTKTLNVRGYGNNNWLARASSAYGKSATGFKLKAKDPTAMVLWADTASLDSDADMAYATAAFFGPYGFPDTPATAGDGKTLVAPTFYARHRGRGSVLWADTHASLELPTCVPADERINGRSVTKYTRAKLGYLIPPGVNNIESLPAQGYCFPNPAVLTQFDKVNSLVVSKTETSGNSTITYNAPRLED